MNIPVIYCAANWTDHIAHARRVWSLRNSVNVHSGPQTFLVGRDVRSNARAVIRIRFAFMTSDFFHFVLRHEMSKIVPHLERGKSLVTAWKRSGIICFDPNAVSQTWAASGNKDKEGKISFLINESTGFFSKAKDPANKYIASETLRKIIPQQWRFPNRFWNVSRKQKQISATKIAHGMSANYETFRGTMFPQQNFISNWKRAKIRHLPHCNNSFLISSSPKLLPSPLASQPISPPMIFVSQAAIEPPDIIFSHTAFARSIASEKFSENLVRRSR